MRNHPTFDTRSCVALVFALVLTATSAADTTEAPRSPQTTRTETGFLSLRAQGDHLSGQLQIPRHNLEQRFPSDQSAATIGAALAQDFSLVADGQFCQVQWVPSPQAASAGLVQWDLETDCPANPKRLDAHFSPFGHKQPQYQTLVTWHQLQNVQLALSTAAEACVAFEADTAWRQLVDLAALPRLFGNEVEDRFTGIHTIRTRKPVNSGK